MNMLPDPDQELVATIRKDGIGILRQLLSRQEVETVRQEFDQAHLDLGKGAGTPGVRDSLSGEALLAYPNLAALYSHPRIMAIVAAMLNEPVPWVWVVKTNRYTPEHSGVSRHTDGFLGELAPPFTRQAMAVFLDDVDQDSGALTYVPGTHLLHYDDDPQRLSPTQSDIDAGDYVPVTPKAGDVVFRVPEVWHAVIPIHHMRRYVTASYAVRGQLSGKMQQRAAATRVQRQEIPLKVVPRDLQPYWLFNQD
jgi:hypothetical protein